MNIKFFSTFSLLLIPAMLLAQTGVKGVGMPAGELFQLILKKTEAAPVANTVDVVKEGDVSTPVTGIITTMFATMDVLKQAVAKNCNMIIAHEPVFYNHADQTASFQNDPVYLEKKKYILDHKLVVFRFHDYIHRIKPDPMQSGFAEKTGWQKYVQNNMLNQYLIPETTLRNLVVQLKQVYPKTALYVVGNPDIRVSRIRISPGASGAAAHINYLRDPNVDVVIAGEASQWETYEYTRDAMLQGKNKAAIFLGHVASEEPGMEFVVGWLKGFIKDTPIHFIEAGPSYWSL